MGKKIISNQALLEKKMKMKTKKRVEKKYDLKILKSVKESLINDKAINLKIIDIRKKSAFADFIIISTGTSHRHIVTMAKNLKEKIKKDFDFISSIEGEDNSGWILIDASSIVINIFKAETREFYNLEKIWDN